MKNDFHSVQYLVGDSDWMDEDWLCGPDGLRVPGALFCQAHAEECIRDYEQVLGETWSAVDIEGPSGTRCTGLLGAQRATGTPVQGSLFGGDAA